MNNILNIDELELNNIELNAVLYYADFLSLKETSTPVTDTCKYFFVYNSPINCACVDNHFPFYCKDSKYFKQSASEYIVLKEKFGEDGVLSFIDNIANLAACGCVDGKDMLKCIHRYSTRGDRNKALKKYETWCRSLKYQHLIKDDEGKPKWQECSKYVAHADKADGLRVESSILGSCRIN